MRSRVCLAEGQIISSGLKLKQAPFPLQLKAASYSFLNC